MKVLVLNKNNIVPDSNNSKLRFKFNTTVNFKKGCKMAISKINMYYSWENVTSIFNNSDFSYTWWDTSGNSKTYNLSIPYGYWSCDDINDWMYSELIARGHYLTFTASGYIRGTSNGIAHVNSSTKYVFMELSENSTYYALQFRLYTLPAWASPSSQYGRPSVAGYEWSVPVATVSGTITTYQSPKIIISSSNNFKNLVGFSPGTYGTGSSVDKYGDVLSDYAPTLDPVGSILILSNLCDNKYSSPSSLIDTFTYSVDYGGMIAIENNNLNWINIAQGAYSEFNIEFKNQNFQDIVIKDPSIVVTIVIDEPEE